MSKFNGTLTSGMVKCRDGIISTKNKLKVIYKFIFHLNLFTSSLKNSFGAEKQLLLTSVPDLITILPSSYYLTLDKQFLTNTFIAY